MNNESFVDYYELLQVSPNADEDSIHRIFRYLAKKYHPDNAATGNSEHFNLLAEAHRKLTDSETRAEYDVRYQQYWDRKWKMTAEASDPQGFGDDEIMRERLLSLLYVQRRRNLHKPGLGEVELSRLIGSPLELVQFHVWYLKEKGWIKLTDNGLLAITALGVDQVEQNLLRLDRSRLIEARTSSSEDEKEMGPKRLAVISPLLKSSSG
ncbi:MAG: DnaJ domain-containing protein [Thermodesulfobacteriota bacterium]